MRLILIIIATAFTSVLSGCGLMGKGRVEAIVRRGAPFDALDSKTDIERVELIVPPGNSYVNRTTASNLTVSGICISGSAAVYIALVSTDISQTVACDGSTGAFSSVLDLGKIPDGIVTISIAFLRNLVSTTPIYATQRNIAKGTTYTVSVVALDAAGNATASSNTGTFTRAGPVNFTILATLNSNLPAGVTSVDFFTTTGASSTYCSPGFTYCNPNETAFRDSVTVTMTPGRTITVGSNLTGSDMYLIGLVNPAGVSCEPNVGSPRNFAYVTGNATIDIICRLDPPDPTGFTATAASSTQMNLSWTSGAGTTNGYRIAYKAGIVAPADCNTSGAGITLIAEGDITGTSHQVTGLTTNAQYSFRLCSINPIPLTPAQSAGVTATGTTAAFLGSASAKGKHIYASWSNGISPYVASIYSDNACTNLMKSTGSTVEVEALFAEFSIPGTYYFKAVDSQSHATSCQSVSLSAAGTEGVSITIVGVDSSYLSWYISEPAFGNVLWQFAGWNCNLGAGKKILTSTENGGGWTGSVESLAFGTIYSFLVTPDSGNNFSPCASPKTSDTFLVQNIYLHDSWAAVKLGGNGTLDVGLYAGTDTSCTGTALFTKPNLSPGDYVGLSTTASGLTADAIYNLRVHDAGNSSTSCDVIRTRSWVPTFTVSASNIVANTSVDLTWSGASGGLYTLLRFNASNSNRCDGPGVPVYSGASSAMPTDAVSTGTYHYRVIGGAGPGYPEVSNCLQVVVP